MAAVTVSSLPLSVPNTPASTVPLPKRPPHNRTKTPPMPLCWGHRGASAAYPENTLASFEAAIRDGAEGIESDVHITNDNEIVMFHDPRLDRTTNGTGSIHTQNYYGVLDKLVTNKSPAQKIPTFRETIALLMRPENSHVFLNIDCKVDNDPSRLFPLMHSILSSYPEFETTLGPRLVLGLWHPKFIGEAEKVLPYIRLAHIGLSPALARKFFWDKCGSFSMSFGCLVGSDGERFREECKAAGKDLYVWTVNKRAEMIEATKWGATAILTDRTAEFLQLRADMDTDWVKVAKETSFLFPWTSIWYSSIATYILSYREWAYLVQKGGDFKVLVK